MNVAKYNFGKVRLELMQSAVSPFTVHDLRGGPFRDLQGICVSLPFSCSAACWSLRINCSLSANLCWILIQFADSHTRNTLNSQSAAYNALSIVLESEGIPPQSVSAPLKSSMASTAPSISASVVSPPFWSPSPMPSRGCRKLWKKVNSLFLQKRKIPFGWKVTKVSSHSQWLITISSRECSGFQQLSYLTHAVICNGVFVFIIESC